MISIDIFILTKDRESYLKESVDSIVKSLNKCNNVSAQITISNNSENKILVNTFYPFCKIINRKSMSVNDHVKICIENAKLDFIMLFHDDDILDINYFNNIYNLIANYPNYSAYAMSAQCINTNGNLLDIFYYNTQAKTKSIGPSDIIFHYFIAAPLSYPPFSSYIYRKKDVKGFFPDIKDAGKFADVTFLYHLSGVNNLLWSNAIGMYYRIHESNDGSIQSISDYTKLIKFFIKKKCNIYFKVKLLYLYFIYCIKYIIKA
jgi:hypothetical protein